MFNHIITSVLPNPQVEDTIKLVFTHDVFETFTGVNSLSTLFIFNHMIRQRIASSGKSSRRTKELNF